MGFAAFLGSLFSGILAAEAPKVIGWLESKLPGAVGEFVSHVLGSPSTQGWLTNLEQQAGADISRLVGQGLGALEALCHAHIHGQVGTFVDSKLAQLAQATVFSPAQEQAFAVLVAAGKFDELAKQALKDLGL